MTSAIKSKARLKDLAREAGVSIATVSRYLRGMSGVGEKTQGLIVRAADKLEVPLPQRSKAAVVAFLLSNRPRLHPFHSRVLEGAEQYCSALGFNMLYVPFRYEFRAFWQDLRLPPLLERRESVRGIIVAGSNSRGLLDMLAHKQVPFVVLGNNVLGEWRNDACDVVWFDDLRGARELTAHLQSLGHRDIWYVGNPRMAWYARRYEGYLRAMDEAGLTPHLSSIDSDDEKQLGYLATKTILSQGKRVTAIFAGNDLAASGVYEAVRDHELSIPGDISVAGFGDIEATMAYPSLTSVRVFADQVGRQLAGLLMDRITQPELPPQRRVTPTQLVKRDSCASIVATAGVMAATPEIRKQTQIG